MVIIQISWGNSDQWIVLGSPGGSFRPQERALWCSVGSFRPTPDSNCNLGGFIRPTEKPVGHSPCAALRACIAMSRQECFTREQVLQQLFSQQPSSEPEEDTKELDREADGQGHGEEDREADREEDTDNADYDYDEDDNSGDYDPVGDPSADSSSLEEEEEGQDHGITTTTTTGLVERETFPSRNREITWSSRAYGREEGRCSSSSSSSSYAAAQSGC